MSTDLIFLLVSVILVRVTSLPIENGIMSLTECNTTRMSIEKENDSPVKFYGNELSFIIKICVLLNGVLLCH